MFSRLTERPQVATAESLFDLESLEPDDAARILADRPAPLPAVGERTSTIAWKSTPSPSSRGGPASPSCAEVREAQLGQASGA